MIYECSYTGIVVERISFGHCSCLFLTFQCLMRAFDHSMLHACCKTVRFVCVYVPLPLDMASVDAFPEVAEIAQRSHRKRSEVGPGQVVDASAI